MSSISFEERKSIIILLYHYLFIYFLNIAFANTLFSPLLFSYRHLYTYMHHNGPLSSTHHRRFLRQSFGSLSSPLSSTRWCASMGGVFRPRKPTGQKFPLEASPSMLGFVPRRPWKETRFPCSCLFLSCLTH